MKKLIQFKPAFDKRNADPSKNYGIHCMDMHMVLIGPLGAISFCIYTGWYLPDSITGHNDGTLSQGACICYHAHHAQYEEQKPSCNMCEYIGVPCYSDCSYLATNKLFEQFVAEGEDIVWQTLEQWYVGRFGAISIEETQL